MIIFPTTPPSVGGLMLISHRSSLLRIRLVRAFFSFFQLQSSLGFRVCPKVPFMKGPVVHIDTRRFFGILSVAAVAAITIPARAQSNVYSRNIVGYATVTLAAGYNLIANPLSTGQTNGANEIGLQIPSEQILTLNGPPFDYVSYEPSFGGWVDAKFAPSQPPRLPPGRGFFFFNPNATVTNFTFVGEVIPGPSSTNYFSPASGYIFSRFTSTC